MQLESIYGKKEPCKQGCSWIIKFSYCLNFRYHKYIIFLIQTQNGSTHCMHEEKNLSHEQLNLGGLFRGSFWDGERAVIISCLKLIRIMLETSKWHEITHTYAVSKNIAFSAKALLILLMSAFFAKTQPF